MGCSTSSDIDSIENHDYLSSQEYQNVVNAQAKLEAIIADPRTRGTTDILLTDHESKLLSEYINNGNRDHTQASNEIKAIMEKNARRVSEKHGTQRAQMDVVKEAIKAFIRKYPKLHDPKILYEALNILPAKS